MKYFIWLGGVLVFALVSCSEPPSPSVSVDAVEETESAVAERPLQNVDFSNAAEAFQQSAQTYLNTAVAQCVTLQSTVDAFLDNPTEETLSEGQSAYETCYLAWMSASIFFQQPFALAEQDDFNELVDLIDTRPFQPGYIDGIDEYPFSGIVHDLDVAISAGNIRGQHRLMDEESASVGFPVIEFFLWKRPVDAFWLEQGETANLAERRKEYLDLAMNLLIDELSGASIRWQASGGFTNLPERTQMAFVLRSFQRLTMVELLNDQFETDSIAEPEWHHSALISGNGRQYIIQQLETVSDLIGQDGQTTAFSTWLAEHETTPVSAEQLQNAVTEAINSVSQLPENYPFDTEANETWLTAQQAIANCALLFSRLSEYMQVPIVTR